MDSNQIAFFIILFSFILFFITFICWFVFLTVKKIKTKKIIEKTIKEQQQKIINDKK